MWSSTSSPPKSSSSISTSSTTEHKWNRWGTYGNPLLSTQDPIPVLEDAKLDLDLNRLNAFGKAASVSLHHGSTFEDESATTGYNFLLTEHHKNTVKIARLPSSVSEYYQPSKGLKRLKEDHVSKIQPPNVETFSARKSASENRPCNGTLEVLFSENASKRKDSTTSNLPPRAERYEDTKNFNSFTQVSTNHITINSGINEELQKNANDASDERDDVQHLKESRSLMKKKLDDGLAKIMAELEAYKLPYTAKLESISRDSGEKKRTLQEDINDLDDGKENDSPCKRSRSSHNECSEGQLREEKPFRKQEFKDWKSTDQKDDRFGLKSERESKKNLNSSNNKKATSDACSHKDKLKSYDPEKAREYIRQQKSSRIDHQKLERERKIADMEVRKQKLRELSRTSLRLVQASIKRKSGQHQEVKSAFDKESKVLINSEKNSATKAAVSKSPAQSERTGSRISMSSEQKANSDSNLRGVVITPGPNLNTSKAELIRDIYDMKARIEMMTKSLKTTIQANRSTNRSTSNNIVAKVNEKSDLTLKTKGSGSNLQPSSSIASQDKNINIAQPIHSSNSNQTLSRALLKSSGSATLIKSDSPHTHDSKRCSENEKISVAKTCSVENYASKSLQPNKIATTYPTLPMANVESTRWLRSNSETDVAGLVSKTEQSHQNQQSSNNFVEHSILELSGGPLEFTESVTPDWLIPLTKEPYPINFITAVKKKLNKTLDNDRLSLTSAIQNNQERSTSLTDMKNQDGQGIVQFTSNILGNPLKLETPSFRKGPSVNISDRGVTVPTFEEASSTALKNIDPLNSESPFSLVETNVLDPEKMRQEFANALNGVEANEMTPAEKPLSAPNTPNKGENRKPRIPDQGTCDTYLTLQAKKTVERSVSPLKLDFNEEDYLKSAPTSDLTSETTVSSLATKTETSALVPPNINLDTKRVVGKRDDVNRWVSHRRGSRDSKPDEMPHENDKCAIISEIPKVVTENTDIGHIFNPTALHLQFQAELNILDSFNESLCQLMEVEKMHEVALARQHQRADNKIVETKDKAIEVQKSLGNSESSNINYTRGTGDPSNMSILTVQENEMTDKTGGRYENTSSQSSSLKDVRTESRASTTASGSLTSIIKEENHDIPIARSNASGTSDKSVSEAIDTGSGSIPEQISSKSVSVDLQEKSDEKDKMSNSSKTSKTPNNETFGGLLKKLPGDVSFELSLHSEDMDSFLGSDGLIMDSVPHKYRMQSTLMSAEDSYEFNIRMLQQLIHEEEHLIQHKLTLLKLRKRTLTDKAHVDCRNLTMKKKKLREKGDSKCEDQISAVRKKQRGIVARLQQELDEIERIKRTEELASEERRLMYLGQLHSLRMHNSARMALQQKGKKGTNIFQRSGLLFKSIHESHLLKGSRKNFATTPVELTLTHSNSQVSDVSHSPALSSTSQRQLGAGDSDSSQLDDRALNELEGRGRQSQDRRQVADKRRSNLEQEEYRSRDIEKQGHFRARSSHPKLILRDRSTSPFHFPDSGVSNGNGNGKDPTRAEKSSIAESSGTTSIEEKESSAPEQVSEHLSEPSPSATLNATNNDEYAQDSFESEVSEVKTAESLSLKVSPQYELSDHNRSQKDSEEEAKPHELASNRFSKNLGVTIKVPLSPRLQKVQRRRHSSGSDDSIALSQTETGSEQSDIEGRIFALTEQLQQRKAEAERLRREAKRTRNERLIAKEQSLQKQLQAYETYIWQARRNLESELKQSSVPIVRPQIKQPRVVSGKTAPRRQDVASVSGVDRSVYNSSISEMTVISPRKDDSEVDFKEIIEPASEAISTVASEIASEVASEIPSDVSSEVASEVSENTSVTSNDAPSLVANKLENSDSKPAETEAVNKFLSHNGDEAECAAQTEKNNKEVVNSPAEVFPLNSEEDKNDPKQTSMEETDKLEVTNDQIDSGKNEDSLNDGVDQIKRMASEDEVEEISDDREMECESEGEPRVIRVILREKDKEQKKEMPSDTLKVKVIPNEDFVGQLADNILENLLVECFDPTLWKNLPQKRSVSVDKELSNYFLNRSLAEATDDILNIYKQKVGMNSSSTQPESRSREVRNKVDKILAEPHSPSSLWDNSRVRNSLKTTYGNLSPEDSPCASPNLDVVASKSHSSSVGENDSLVSAADGLTSNSSKTVDVIDGYVCRRPSDRDNFLQDWFEEDYGLTHPETEAEKLRLQQLQIEQEIEELQQQKAQVQEQIPYYYVREIPNKPPPPYTPPGQAPRLRSSGSTRHPTIQEIQVVASDQASIIKDIKSATDLLYDAYSEAKNISMMQAPESFIEAGCDKAQAAHLSEKDLAIWRNNARSHRTFIFDLAKELVEDVYCCERQDPIPPWLRSENILQQRRALSAVPKSREALHEVITNRVLVLFGFVSKASKENLAIRWSRKKRDNVDELLVMESQEQEREWIDYEQDEAVIKHNVMMAILNSILDDAVQDIRDVYRRREEREQCPVS